MGSGESRRMVVTEELLKTLKKKAKAAPVINRSRRRSWLTKGDAVLAIREEIQAMMRDKGYSYRDVARWMSENGCEVTAQQVSTALRKAGGDGVSSGERLERTDRPGEGEKTTGRSAG